jgi:hypothetical protein
MNREAEREARRPWRPRWLLRLRVALSKQSLDSRLLAGESPAESPELGERYAQLQRPQYRRGLAERLEHIVDAAWAPDWLNRRSARVPLAAARSARIARCCSPYHATWSRRRRCSRAG